MKPVTCHEVDQQLWGYIDRELSASTLAAISFHLKGCEECRSLYLDRAREASQYRQVFLDTPFGEPFVARMRKRMREEGLHRVASQPGWSGVSFHRRRLFRIGTVAAMVLLIPVVVLVGFLSRDGEGVRLGEFSTSGGRAMVYRAAADPADEGAQERLKDGDFSPGDRLVLEPGAVAGLRLASPSWRGDSRVTLTGPASLLFEPGSTRTEFRARLTEGRLSAEVTEREASEPFVITTPHARATVIGTVFDLEATAEETRLTVMKGKVKFEAADALPTDYIHVTPGDGAFLVRAGETHPERAADEPEESASRPADPAAGTVSETPAAPVGNAGSSSRPPSPPAGPVPPAALPEADKKPLPQLPFDLDTPVSVPPERE